MHGAATGFGALAHHTTAPWISSANRNLSDQAARCRGRQNASLAVCLPGSEPVRGWEGRFKLAGVQVWPSLARQCGRRRFKLRVHVRRNIIPILKIKLVIKMFFTMDYIYYDDDVISFG